MKPQHNPPHPGEVLWGLEMQPAGLTVTHVAAQLGIDRKTLSRVINGRASVSVELALRLAKAFRTTPQLWLNMQRNYDLWKTSRELAEKINAIRPIARNPLIYATP